MEMMSHGVVCEEARNLREMCRKGTDDHFVSVANVLVF
jgi:hypothetical protein